MNHSEYVIGKNRIFSTIRKMWEEMLPAFHNFSNFLHLKDEVHNQIPFNEDKFENIPIKLFCKSCGANRVIGKRW